LEVTQGRGYAIAGYRTWDWRVEERRRDSISRLKPKLAISVYHNLMDGITIPKLMRQIRPDYELLLDHYTLHWEETILYAAPPSRLNGA
jgi:uncharacterized protein YfaQ (DUF2300 family)